MQQYMTDVCNMALDYPAYVVTGRPKQISDGLSPEEFNGLVRKVAAVSVGAGILSSLLGLPVIRVVVITAFYLTVHELRQKDSAYQEKNYASKLIKKVSEYLKVEDETKPKTTAQKFLKLWVLKAKKKQTDS